MEGIYAAVTRRNARRQRTRRLGARAKNHVEEALRAYTIDAAYAGFSEETLGSLEPGEAGGAGDSRSQLV